MATTTNDLTGTPKMPDAKRPPSSQAGPSAVDAMKGSAPAPDSIAPVAQFGEDGTKLFNQAGQILSQGFPVRPVLEPGIAQPGDDSNVSGTPAGTSGGFPTTSKSRVPQASSPGPRTTNLNKLRRK